MMEAPQAAPAPEQEGGASAADAPMAVQEALGMISQAMAENPKMPKEALAALDAAQGAYNDFIQIYAQSMGVDMGAPAPKKPMGMSSVEVQGAKGAVPVDQPMGKNAVPLH